jgi:hypothetical protein
VDDLAISDTTILARAVEVIATEVDGEAVVMNIERGQCYGFDAIGTRIWTSLERPMRVGELCAVLVGEYDVDAETCRRDVARLLGELVRERLVTISNEDFR